MSNVVYMTKEGVQNLEEEIHYLKTVERKEVAQKIADARSHGDLSENAEYDAAKQLQELLEIKINKLESTLGRVQVIRPDELPNDKVYILSKVKVQNKKNNAILEYMLVSDAEADFEKQKISVLSPIGKALMGKAIGEQVEVKVPAGKLLFEILEINR
ncbi:MAG: transcription elongation factor GreA [Ignavibacteria bacterium]|nr:transcription elongation factor GreA [Ignavibacteria bacterium]